MNKEQILECFYNPRHHLPNMARYCDLYDVYLTSQVQEPANFEVSKSEKPIIRNLPRDNMSVSNTLSICSALSRISIDRTVYIDILNNRKKHDVFLTLDGDEPDVKKWHYLDESEMIRGPFSSRQMNDFFIFNKISDKTMVKEAFKNDDFIPFKLVVKRYYKKITEEVEEAKRRKPDLKARTKLFKKGEFVTSKKSRMENIHYNGRADRVLTQGVQPTNLHFLEEAIEDPELLQLLEPRKGRSTTTG
jgi:hypothetical protein